MMNCRETKGFLLPMFFLKVLSMILKKIICWSGWVKKKYIKKTLKPVKPPPLPRNRCSGALCRWPQVSQPHKAAANDWHQWSMLSSRQVIGCSVTWWRWDRWEASEKRERCKNHGSPLQSGILVSTNRSYSLVKNILPHRLQDLKICGHWIEAFLFTSRGWKSVLVMWGLRSLNNCNVTSPASVRSPHNRERFLASGYTETKGVFEVRHKILYIRNFA